VPARYPDRSAALSLTWADTLAASEWSYFVRGDARYTGKSYTEEANFAWLGKFWLFNLRSGFEKNHLRVEGYVRNLFNDDHWLAGARWSDFSTTSSTGFLTSQGIIVTPPEKRTIGVRVAFDF
jgi:outer membrane cobalamin receptor